MAATMSWSRGLALRKLLYPSVRLYSSSPKSGNGKKPAPDLSSVLAKIKGKKGAKKQTNSSRIISVSEAFEQIPTQGFTERIVKSNEEFNIEHQKTQKNTNKPNDNYVKAGRTTIPYVDKSVSESNSEPPADTGLSNAGALYVEEKSLFPMAADEKSDPDSASKTIPEVGSGISGFSRLIEKFESSRVTNDVTSTDTIVNEDTKENVQLEDTKSFATLLRNSKLMQIGDYRGRIVLGIITKIVEDDLYIDFGGKFHCVCKMPAETGQQNYVIGSKVKIQIFDMEMTSKFLGADRHITILEADGTLVGLN